MHDLSGRVAVVTGAGSGIGRSLASRLSKEGVHVVIADVEEAALRGTAELVGGDVVAVPTDVTRRDDVIALADRAFDVFGAVDVLCNNAGVFQGGLIWERTQADFEWTLGVNLWGILHAIQVFVPRMLEQTRDSHIVNTVSMGGLATTPFSGPYYVSKFAAMAATECLAQDLASVGAPIKVSALCPSLIATGLSRSERNRPASLQSEPTESSAFVAEAMVGSTAAGLHPDVVAEMVLDAVREERFLIPTKESYAAQVTDRAEDLLARRLPRSAEWD
jgi:NAD(P)-dependent dehydrogenase (short-subunit alcohol dehydrogenase family)